MAFRIYGKHFQDMVTKVWKEELINSVWTIEKSRNTKKILQLICGVDCIRDKVLRSGGDYQVKHSAQ